MKFCLFVRIYPIKIIFTFLPHPNVFLSYFHQFSNVTMSDTKESLPKRTIYLTFCDYFDQPINTSVY